MRSGLHHHHHRGMGREFFGHHAMRGGGRFGAGPGWGMEGEERGRGGGRRRLFDGGELRLVLLRLIGDQPRHGYDLIRAIEERTGGAYGPSPGVVYPTLTLLDDMGLIEESPSEGKRKLFTVTPEGLAELEAKAAEIARLMARLDAMGEMQGRSEHLSVRRSLHNLRAVLVNRLASGETEAETIHAIVALIDETAQKIERL